MSHATGVADEPAESAEREDDTEAERADDHLDDLPDGAGCTEIWEHLSSGRDDGE